MKKPKPKPTSQPSPTPTPIESKCDCGAKLVAYPVLTGKHIASCSFCHECYHFRPDGSKSKIEL